MPKKIPCINYRDLPSYSTPTLFCFHFEEFLVLNNNFIFIEIFLTLNTFQKKNPGIIFRELPSYITPK
jgi:hypothetical protein